MKVTQHGQNLYQLTRLIAFNCFLVQEEDGLTLVDTNLPGSADAILQAVKDQSGEIKRIVLTHSHNDHVASLDALKASLPDVPVYISEREAPMMAGDLSLKSSEPQAKPKGSYMTTTTTPNILVNEGDMIGSLRVVAAPGHTPGHVAFMDTRDKTLIAGDAFTTQAGIGVSGKMNILFPFPAMATWHKPTALETAKKLRDLQPSRLAVGHGRVIDSPIADIEKAISAFA